MWLPRKSIHIKNLTYILLLLTTQIFAQDYLNLRTFENVKTFPDVTFQDIAEDDYGFIWLATNRGLFKFDGIEFTVPEIPTESHQIVPKELFVNLMKDRQGRIWAGSFSNGLFLIDLKQNKAQHFLSQKDAENTISDNRIKKIFEDPNGRIWVGCHKEGFCLYRPETNDFQRFKPSEILNKKENARFLDDITSLYFRQEKLWLGTLDRLLCFDPETETLEHIDVENLLINREALKKSFSAVRNMCWLDDHRFLFHTYTSDNVVFLYDVLRKKCEAIRLTPKNSTNHGNGSSIHLFGQSAFYFVGENIAKINLHDWSVKWMNNEERYSNLPFNIGHIFVDSQHNKWAFSRNQLYLWESSPSAITVSGLANSAEVLFHLEANNYFFLNEMDTKGGFINIENGEIELSPEQFMKEKHSTNRVANLYKTQKQGIFTNNQASIFNWNGQSSSFNPFLNLSDYSKRNKLGDFISGFLDLQNIYWLGTKNDGIVQVDIETKEKKWVKNTPEESNRIVYNGYPRGFFEDDLGNVWFGTDRGFGYYNSNRSHFVNFPYESYKTDNPRINLKSISKIKKDSKNRIWLAGEADGLGYFEFGESNPIIKTISTKDGLWNTRIRDLLIDQSGNIWVSHWRGLSRIFSENLRIENYGKEIGMPNYAALTLLNDGTIGILKNGKLLQFQPDSLSPKVVFPKTTINDFKVFDESLNLGKNWLDIEQIELSYAQNFFSIDFGVINFLNPELTEIQYKLEGVQKEWTNAENRTYASFANVGGGDYEFKVRARIQNGEWAKPHILNIFIASPFWETWWFYLLIALILGLIIYGLYLNKVKQIREKEILKSQFKIQLAEVEMIALRAQMNPHFLFNCLNSIKLFIVENDTQAASDYLTKFSKLIRLILQNSKSKMVLLSDELKALKLYIEMEKMRFDNQFEYRIIVAENVSPHHLEIPQLILQPFVENAIWHGLVHEDRPNLLKISIEKRDRKTLCIIEDNGIGREEAHNRKRNHQFHKKSMGMAITQNRIELTRNLYQIETKVEIIDLKDENGSATGTRVVLSILAI